MYICTIAYNVSWSCHVFLTHFQRLFRFGLMRIIIYKSSLSNWEWIEQSNQCTNVIYEHKQKKTVSIKPKPVLKSVLHWIFDTTCHFYCCICPVVLNIPFVASKDQRLSPFVQERTAVWARWNNPIEENYFSFGGASHVLLWLLFTTCAQGNSV